MPDFSESYVNYHVKGGLIGFEVESGNPGLGDLVINVENMTQLRTDLEKAGVKIVKSNPGFFMIKDPEERTLIFEPNA